MNVTIRIGLAAAALAVGGVAAALDPPHDESQGRYCYDCHVLHEAAGGTITAVEGNANLCDSCHASITDVDGKHFGFPWVPGDQAVPGATGRSHRWDAEVTARGAHAPTDAEMLKRLDGNRLQCSTCHSQHSSGGKPGDPTFRGGTQRVGGPNATTVTVGVSRAPNGGGGSGRMTLATVTASAAPLGYRIQLSGLPSGKVAFKISHDQGRSWFAWNGTAWYADTAGTGAGKEAPVSSTAPVDLDDGASVQINFPSAAGYQIGAYWDFWISYPFLRAPLAADALCTQCHADRAQTHAQIEGTDPTLPANGTTVYSHPVSEPLDTARGHRAVPLDADGSVAQSPGDGNATNDIVLEAGVVRCTSCHAPHNADSNSLSVDAR